METKSKGGKIADMPDMDIQNLFKDVKFPAKKNELVDQLRKNKVSPEILQDIGMLPDKEYKSSDEIIQQFKKEL
jgi:hypothetical protein